jgi:hypothetical protein
VTPFPGSAPPPFGHDVGRDAEEPRREGRAAPLEASYAGEGLVEDVGGQVLGLGAVADAAGDERVHAIEMKLVQLAETARGLSWRLPPEAARESLFEAPSRVLRA